MERVGRYVDGFIKAMVSSLPSYARDTRDVLAKLQDLEIPGGALLVGIDVESLYTSIPQEWGLRFVSYFLEVTHLDFGTPNEFILELLELALTNNYFQFLNGFYQQTRRTAMGAPWAPSYACLHQETVYQMPMYLNWALTWLRYIDDIFMVWLREEEQLEFLSALNNNGRDIRLTHMVDPKTISFLDLQISINGNQISTCTFR